MKLTTYTTPVLVAALTIGLSVSYARPRPPKEVSHYVLADLLGIPGGSGLQSQAVAVNEPDASGAVQLVGNSYITGEFHPAEWSVNANGTEVSVSDIGLSADELAGSAYDINDWGDVVFGTILDSQASGGQEGAAWVMLSGQEPQELDIAGGVDVHVRAINNAGEIAGWIVFQAGKDRYARGALWRLVDGVPGSPIDLGDFLPSDISQNGIVAGEDLDAAVAAIATVDGSGTVSVVPLGVLPGHSSSAANAISDNGAWVVGHSRSASESEGFRWSSETGLVGLGRFAGIDGEALDVNNNGDAVGWSDTAEGKWSQTAVLWKNQGTMQDLNSMVDTKAHLQWAHGINDAGHIAGHMDFSKPTSEQHGFLLIPSALLN